MSDVAVLGIGLLGAGFAENLLAKGHHVRVWNRTAAKAQALQEKGALVAADPAAAVRGATHVHLVLAEDTAVDGVIAALRPGLGAGVPLFDHSTNLPARVAARSAELRAAGVRYVSAPVFMAPQNARTATGTMLLAGAQAEVEPWTSHLATLTGTLVYVGERSDLAAVWKLAGNSLFFALSGAAADVFAIGAGCGVDRATMLRLFEHFTPSPALVAKRVAAADGNPASFELTMARKDARLMLEAAGSAPTMLLPILAQAMDQAIARGEGQRDYAIFARR